MYLEKLEVQGFKSFANKNKLIFPGLIDGQKKGLTAIVGPNGSGKSNVADAIRWALGEQSLKLLRGKKSEDVIFSGSDKKHQLGLAEVSLYLNNDPVSKKTAPTKTDDSSKKTDNLDKIIANYEQIVVTRRLYRSGESEYLLNGNRVRLADIQMLLAKANFGQKTYSVIGQGMVENFLTSSAGERKNFFDEATGVKQFQIKRDTALNKLENSYHNLQQVDMLLAEIKPRLKSLTRQVEKLKKRGAIEQTLKQNQLDYYGSLWQEINEKLESANQKLLEGENDHLKEEKKLQGLNNDLDKIRRSSDWSQINDLQERLQELNAQKNQWQKQLARLQAELELKLESQGKFDLSWLNNKQTELKAELEKIKHEIDAASQNDFSKRFKNLDNDLKTVNNKISELDRQKQTIHNLENEKNSYLNQLTKLEAVLEANLENHGSGDLPWLKHKQEELKRTLEKLTTEMDGLKKQNESSQLESQKQKLNSIQQRLDSLNLEMRQINQKLKENKNQNNNQSKAINDLVNDFLKKLDAISQENELIKMRRMISEIKDDFQKNIKKLLGGHDDAALQNLKEIQATIISLTEERQKISVAFSNKQSLVKSLQERHRLLAERYSQVEIELTEINNKLNQAQTEFDPSKIEREKEDLTNKITELNRRLNKLDQSTSQKHLEKSRWGIIEQQQELRVQESSFKERLRLLIARQKQLTQELKNLAEKITANQNQPNQKDQRDKKEELETKIENLDQEIKETNRQLDELNQSKDHQKNQIFKYQRELQEIQQKINKHDNTLNQIRVEAARQETKLEDLENNIREDGLVLSDIRQHQVQKNDSTVLSTLAKSIASKKSQLEAIGGIDPEAETEYQQTKERYDFLNSQIIDLKKAIKSLEEIIYELDKNIKDRFNSEFKIIAEKFNEYFKILFNGGRAKIFKLTTDESDENNNVKTASSNYSKNERNDFTIQSDSKATQPEINDKLKVIKFLKKHSAADLSGIEIQATPPGKKIQTVTMLSGGERALTATALICAIISANPAPFVVLDEVDAALDESNSERLAKILDDLSNKTQFIVITHNRAAMRRASILYGVTMGSDGVSKLLSVKLDDIKD